MSRVVPTRVLPVSTRARRTLGARRGAHGGAVPPSMRRRVLTGADSTSVIMRVSSDSTSPHNLHAEVPPGGAPPPGGASRGGLVLGGAVPRLYRG